MKKFLSIIAISLAICLTSCENYSNGERVGYITQFSEAGAIVKSYEGHLNMSQTGMNSSQAFDFSVDNDAQDITVVQNLQTALDSGYKVELKYHKVLFKNWFNNRGHTDFFVTNVKVLK